MTPRATAERYAPWLAAVAAAILHHFVWPQFYPKSPVELFSNVVGLSGIAVGFLATGQALLCSLADNFVVQFLKKIKRFEEALRFFTSAIRWCLVLALLSLAAYCADFQAHPLAFTIWLSLLAGAFTATVRILYLFSQILHGSQQQ